MLLGDKELEKNGTAMIPCKECSKSFRSYMHYGSYGYTYDDKCDDCMCNYY